MPTRYGIAERDAARLESAAADRDVVRLIEQDASIKPLGVQYTGIVYATILPWPPLRF